MQVDGKQNTLGASLWSIKMIKILAISALAILITSCAGSDTTALLKQLSLDEGEHGSVCARATVASPNPLSRSQVAFVYKEYPEGEAAPEC